MRKATTAQASVNNVNNAGPAFMTTDEFLQLPEEKTPVQLIAGYVVRDPAPLVPHQELVGRLHVVLHQQVNVPRHGKVLLSPTDVVLGESSVLQPDLLAVTHVRKYIIGDRVTGPPDLVIEVESPSTRERDLTVKRMLYAQFGVPEMWFVSGAGKSVLQMTVPDQLDYRNKRLHTAPAALVSSVFPTVTVNLADLFADEQ